MAHCRIWSIPNLHFILLLLDKFPTFLLILFLAILLLQKLYPFQNVIILWKCVTLNKTTSTTFGKNVLKRYICLHRFFNNCHFFKNKLTNTIYVYRST